VSLIGCRVFGPGPAEGEIKLAGNCFRHEESASFVRVTSHSKPATKGCQATTRAGS
jgi:hypothetical protein